MEVILHKSFTPNVPTADQADMNTWKLQVYDATTIFIHLIKVSDDLIEQPEALDAHVVPVQLDVEVVEVGDGGEQHSNLSVGLVVQVLEGKEVQTNWSDQAGRHYCGNHKALKGLIVLRYRTLKRLPSRQCN